jgi:hypothetical protein
MLYFLLALTAVIAATTNAAAPIRDTDGDTVEFDSYYYVLPVGKSRGGGLTLSGRDGRDGRSCPIDVVQTSSRRDKGLPIKFSSLRSRAGYVTESAELQIVVDNDNHRDRTCARSTYWWVKEPENSWEDWTVKVGPNPRESRQQDLSKTVFQIHAFKYDYYFLAYCPSYDDEVNSKVSSDRCRYLGILEDEEGFRRLTLDAQPFMVKFDRTDGRERSSKSKAMAV